VSLKKEQETVSMDQLLDDWIDNRKQLKDLVVDLMKDLNSLDVQSVEQDV
jgi:type I restriction enzyme M protein